MTQMPILWKRLVVDGKTCERCNATFRELKAALDKLAIALRPIGIEPVLEMQEIDSQTFDVEPSESNRIWIAGKPVEEWLGARVGMSPCCSVCGESDCRTLEVAGRSYETIPEELLIRAGLVAASQLMAPASARGDASRSCCGSTRC